MSDSWQADAQALWGEGWKAPLSECWGINRRTVERWSAGEGNPPAELAAALAQSTRRNAAEPRIAGDILRRLASGETAEEIDASLTAARRALRRVCADPVSILLMGDASSKGAT